jgi:uncharacterized protein
MTQPATDYVVTGLSSSEPRIQTLDILRGFAVLGIYWINIIIFGLPTGAYSVPSYIGDAVTVNVSLWAFSEIMVDGAMRGLFSCLFGAGALLYLSEQKLQPGGIQRVEYYYRRNIILILIGLFHAYILLWPYDVVFAYGLLGLFLFPLRKLSARSLIIIGFALLICTDISFYESSKVDAESTASTSQTISNTRDNNIDEALLKQVLIDKYRQSSTSDFQEDIAIHRSTYSELFRVKSNSTMEQHTIYMYSIHVFDIGGMMLLGMALLKLGVLQGKRSVRFYFILMLAGFIVGILMRIPAVYSEITNDFLPDDPLHPEIPGLAISRLPVMLGYIGLILLLYKYHIFSRLFKSLAAVGKLALTHYISQTVISIFLFYGFGFALIGALERYQLGLLCIVIWVFQILFSLAWLKRYRMGPLEWLWRSAIYGKWQSNKILLKTGADTQPIN